MASTSRAPPLPLKAYKKTGNLNNGRLFEIPEIAVDRFLGPDLEASAFFLSHAHSDHMMGLETKRFLDKLESDPFIRLFTHGHSPPLIEAFRTPYLGGAENLRKLIKNHKIIPMKVDEKITIEFPESKKNTSLEVTCLPAGHCPGSVMFLFETKDCRILYTGDCRVTVEDLKKYKPLHDGKGRLKPINSLYFDSTFCYKSASFFPHRFEAVDEALGVINEWISKNGNQKRNHKHLVSFIFAAKFAHEFILLAIYKILGIKVHVDAARFATYRYIDGLKDCVTTDGASTCVHLCPNGSCSILNSASNDRVMRIKLASMWYTLHPDKKPGELPIMSQWAPNQWSLCYSMHSSLEETAAMISYLRPRQVTPLVKPVFGSMDKIQKLLTDCTKMPLKLVDYFSDQFGPVDDPEPEVDDQIDVLGLLNGAKNDQNELEDALEPPEKMAKVQGASEDLNDSQESFDPEVTAFSGSLEPCRPSIHWVPIEYSPPPSPRVVWPSHYLNFVQVPQEEVVVDFDKEEEIIIPKDSMDRVRGLIAAEDQQAYWEKLQKVKAAEDAEKLKKKASEEPEVIDLT